MLQQAEVQRLEGLPELGETGRQDAVRQKPSRGRMLKCQVHPDISEPKTKGCTSASRKVVWMYFSQFLSQSAIKTPGYCRENKHETLKG